ncbi:hypothetical protein [Deinococcus saxicola]|uniref:hypothetical protein n=1 Tax=Deinococcus saxicola TaxID=249406 RepID=UPI0039EFFE0E
MSFIARLIPVLRSRPQVLEAGISAVVAVAAHSLPFRLNSDSWSGVRHCCGPARPTLEGAAAIRANLNQISNFSNANLPREVESEKSFGRQPGTEESDSSLVI